MKDKVLLEKRRIDARVGFEARMHQANAPATSAGLTSCPPDAMGYMANSDRFHSDTAGEEYALRQEVLRKKNQATEFRRNQIINREEERWKQIEQQRHEDEEREKRMRELGLACKRNTSNVSYNILNLQYSQNTSGEQQKYVDDMVRFKAQIRSRDLVVHGGSRAPYNIISGEPRDIPAPLTAAHAPRAPGASNEIDSARRERDSRQADYR
jgi:hypothetical protein